MGNIPGPEDSSALRNRGRTIDMTEGSPYRVVFLFSLPIFLSTVLQKFYNMADTAIAGNIIGDSALAAIGATSALYHIIITFAQGLNTGFSLLISRAFGSKNRDGVNCAVFWTLLLNLGAVVLFSAGSLLFLDPILHVMNTPADIYADARAYVSVIFAGIPITMAYNMGSSVLRSLGNSSAPLLALVISSIFNIILDIFFVKILDLGTAGLAFATVSAQLLSALFCFLYILKYHQEIRFRKSYLHPEKGFVSEMFLTGLSMGSMNMIVSFGGAVLQSAVNRLGSVYIAGQIGGSKIEVFFMCMMTSLAMAVATFVSQNFGAGKKDRILQGVKATYVYCAFGCAVCYLFALSPFPPLTMKWITGSENAEVISSGTRFIRTALFFSPFLCIVLTLRSTLQGMGHKVAPLFASAMEMGGKLLFAWAIVPKAGYTAVCFCEPVLWILCSVYLAVVVRICREEFREPEGTVPMAPSELTNSRV